MPLKETHMKIEIHQFTFDKQVQILSGRSLSIKLGLEKKLQYFLN